MNNTKNLFVTPNEKLLCITGTEHLFSVCNKTSDFVTETVAENIEEKTAHLFAAAPELLAILKKWEIRIADSCADSLCIERMMTMGEAKEIHAAIARAEGRAA
jgi:hypothetical protein